MPFRSAFISTRLLRAVFITSDSTGSLRLPANRNPFRKRNHRAQVRVFQLPRSIFSIFRGSASLIGSICFPLSRSYYCWSPFSDISRGHRIRSSLFSAIPIASLTSHVLSRYANLVWKPHRRRIDGPYRILENARLDLCRLALLARGRKVITLRAVNMHYGSILDNERSSLCK